MLFYMNRNKSDSFIYSHEWKKPKPRKDNWWPFVILGAIFIIVIITL